MYNPRKVGTKHDAISELEARVAKMRELGVTKWGDIELGPAPQPDATETQQPKKTAAEIEQEQRLARRAVALAASGSLVRRLGED
ncbi:MAG: hypothetical protein C4308_14855 [Chitinophagaceae bacterium]